MSMLCRLCEQLIVKPSFTEGICEGCAAVTRMSPMPAPSRRPVPCARCNGLRFVRAMPREYSGDPHVMYPMTVTQWPPRESKVWSDGRTVSQPHPHYGAGALEMYTCLGCGFVEWYCQDPEKIPIGPEYMTDLVEYPGTGPYR